MRTPLLFEPIYKERIWGGSGLAESLGRKLPQGKRIGESWDIVDRPEAESIVARGPEKGRSLRELIDRDPKAIMGSRFPAGGRFPILVKWLDCQDRLSLQVHPPAGVAGQLGGEPKTENWFIASTAPGAHLIVGLKKGTTREAFEKALQDNTLEKCVHRFPVKAGHSIFVRSGQIHAIDEGNLILEIQQNSDTTYRVYDWARVGLDGKPRDLHIDESLASIDFEDFEPEPVSPSGEDQLLAQCDEFTIRKLMMTADRELTFQAGEQPRLLHIVSGRLEITAEDGQAETGLAGNNFLLPFAGGFRISTVEEGVVLVTSDFA